MSQHIPEYTDSDFERVLAREFPGSASEEARRILMAYGLDPCHSWPLRVRMACIRLARGSLVNLGKYIEAACGDPRDVLAWAEYGNFWGARSAADRRAASRKDCDELQEWLRREP